MFRLQKVELSWVENFARSYLDKIWYDAAYTYVYELVKNFARSYLDDQELYDCSTCV